MIVQSLLFGDWYSDELKTIPNYGIDQSTLKDSRLSQGQIILHLKTYDFLVHIATLKIPIEHKDEGFKHYQIQCGDYGVINNSITIHNGDRDGKGPFVIPVVSHAAKKLELLLFDRIIVFHRV